MKFISIGGWCGTAVSLRGNSLYEEALPFDHIRSTFLGIIDCFETDFYNFFPKVIEPDVISGYTYSGRSFRNKYFGFYHHDLKNHTVIEDFKRRINRLHTYLIDTKENVVFVRTISANDYNDEVHLSKRFFNIINSKYPSLNYILVFIIPDQDKTEYYKNIDNKIFIFTLNYESHDHAKVTRDYKPIYDFISNNDLFKQIPEKNEINIKNGYNSFVLVENIPITKDE